MKLKRILSAVISACMILTAASAVTVMADTTATITAYNADGAQMGTYTTLYDAANAAGTNGRIVISEGIIELSQTDQARISGNVTIEGAGSDKTKIIPANPQDFIDALKSGDSNQEWKGYALLEFFQPDPYNNDNAFNLTLRGLTLDGTGIYGTIKEGSIIKTEKPIDFVPLRLSGNRANSNNPAKFILEDIVIKRDTGKNNKGCIQIGTSNGDYGATVTATNLYLDSNAGESNYADIDICDNCSMSVSNGGFNGIILGNFTTPQNVPGYYSATISVSDPDSILGLGKQTLTLYTTIPYLLNAYTNNAENLKDYIGHFDSFTGGTDILNNMATDLINTSNQLYGMDCNEQRGLAEDFSAAIDDLNKNYSANIEVNSKADLDAKLANPDWHTWSDDQDTECDICGATRVIEPEYNTTTGPAIAEQGTEDFDHTNATGFVTTIEDTSDVSSIKWQVTSNGVTKETEVFSIANTEVNGDLKLGIIITGLNDDTATATAIINPTAEEVTE